MENTAKRFYPEQADWTQQDVVLARQFGVSRERVRQWRRKLKKPDPVTKGKLTEEGRNQIRKTRMQYNKSNETRKNATTDDAESGTDGFVL